MDSWRAYDQVITIYPFDRSVMLIAFWILCFTYLPLPGAGAIWTRSTKENPGAGELREFARSEDECRLVIAVASCVLSDRRVSRLHMTGMQGELEEIFPNNGMWLFSARGLVFRGA